MNNAWQWTFEMARRCGFIVCVLAVCWTPPPSFAAPLKTMCFYSAETNINNLKFDDLGRFGVPFPSEEEQNRIVAILDTLRDEVARLESLCTRKLAALDELKQSLLQRAFSGEL